MRNLTEYKKELAAKFGINEDLGHGNHNIYDPQTDELLERLHVKLTWFAHIGYHKASFVVGYMKSDHKQLAVFIPTSLTIKERETIKAVKVSSEPISSILQSFNLVDETETMQLGIGNFDIDMSIDSYKIVSQFRIYNGSSSYNHSTHYELFRALLGMSKKIIHLSNNEYLNSFAKTAKWAHGT